MKISYVAIGTLIIGTGICGYLYLRGKREKSKENAYPNPYVESHTSEMVDFSPSSTNSNAGSPFDNIAHQHQVATEIIRNTFEEIRKVYEDTERKKEEIDELLNDLAK